MWKDVIGYEGLYKVNECGDIYSVPHLRKNGIKGSYVSSPRIMKQRINRSGYSIIRLSKKGNVKDEFVHVIVAKTFLPNPNNLPCVNHKDENKLNNNVSNLE